MAPKNGKPDAGLRSLDHYKIRLPRWRYYIREKFLPIVRWETPYVALLQNTLRSPFLDSYFAMTANLGAHTFFMIMLPIFFWCGYADMGRGMVYMLAAGVYFSGFVKDFMCLPRPLSPPLTRITMSGSVALEYGFPSTHSANAVSVTLYAIYELREGESAGTPINLCLQGLAYFYAFSIMLGRLYCGMHGFFDVISGSVLGALIGYIQCAYGAAFDNYLYNSDLQVLIIASLVICVLVRIHPEPADDCPCYDDSVAFSGVVLGIFIGSWHYARTEYSTDFPTPASIAFDLQKLGLVVATLRIVLGVFLVFAWRAVMKPLLLKVLPPIFRTIEHYGLTLPRRYFTPASQYESVPEQRNDDNVIPSARDIPAMLRRRRAFSIGPQSEADAYEALAYREKRRRDSINNLGTVEASSPTSPSGSFFDKSIEEDEISKPGNRRRASSLEQFRDQMAMGADALSPGAARGTDPMREQTAEESAERDEQQTRLLFSNVQKPRVRYDVEVVTKLIVYCGIAFLSADLNPIIFENVGLGMT